MKEDGSSSILVLTVVIILSILCSGAFLFIKTGSKYIAQSKKKDQEREMLITEVERLVKLLGEDNTPDSNSIAERDALQKIEGKDITVIVEDASSRLNLNWIIGEELKATGMLKSGKSYFEFQSFRAEKGILSDFSRYADFIKEEDIVSYFTPYNYFNINVCSELMLENLYYTRTGDKEKAAHFRNDIQIFRQKSKAGSVKMIEQDSLKEFLGEENYGLLYPVVNALPVMNIHFIPENIMVTLFRYFKIKNPEEKAEYITALREISELSIENLRQIIGEEYYTKNRLHHYIGTITWFWEITVKKNDEKQNVIELKWFVARIPQIEGQEEKVVYRLIKEEFLK